MAIFQDFGDFYRFFKILETFEDFGDLWRFLGAGPGVPGEPRSPRGASWSPDLIVCARKVYWFGYPAWLFAQVLSYFSRNTIEPAQTIKPDNQINTLYVRKQSNLDSKRLRGDSGAPRGLRGRPPEISKDLQNLQKSPKSWKIYKNLQNLEKSPKISKISKNIWKYIKIIKIFKNLWKICKILKNIEKSPKSLKIY